jgi:hypothetical protein
MMICVFGMRNLDKWRNIRAIYLVVNVHWHALVVYAIAGMFCCLVAYLNTTINVRSAQQTV